MDREPLLTLCHALAEAGIWLNLNDQQQLIAGPAHLVKKQPALIAELRTQKAQVMTLLDDSLAHAVFNDKQHDPRFAYDTCPDCGLLQFVITAPRRLVAHRALDNRTPCPGSERAQQACAATIMGAFLTDRCERRPLSQLTWISLKGALEAWCLERGWILPPRPYIIAWMDSAFAQKGTQEEYPRWAGLSLKLLEWGLEEAEPLPPQQAPRLSVGPGKGRP